MRALVTGISGFVGGHLTEYLAAEGDLVVGLSASGKWPTDLAHLDRLAGIEQRDLAAIDESDLADLIVRKQPEAIYHLAAQSNPQASMADPRGTWALNLGGTLNLLEAIRRAGAKLEKKPRVILVGSGVSYGNPAPEHMPVSENCPLRPNNSYSSSKAAADLLGVQHFLSYGTDVVMVRPFNHAGPRQSPQYVLPGLALQVAQVEAGLKPCVEVGNLDIVRDFTDVRDVVRGYRLLVDRGRAGEIYNLGSGRGTKLADALAHLVSLANKPVEVKVDPTRFRPVDQTFLVADPSKLRAETGWEAAIPIEQTLADMLEGSRRALSGSLRTG